jgi:hypothetical protein
MKVVIHTQFKENYGAHDWDGKGECPQYWKFKGGSTYVVECSLEQAMSGQFFTDVAKCIEYSNDYSEEYIVGENLVDDIDFDPAKVVDEWDTAIYATVSNGQLDCREDVKDYTMARNIIGERTWMQCEKGRYDVALERFEEAA